MKNNKNSWKTLSILGLVQVIALFTIILSIVTLFDEYHRYLALFSHFKFQYLFASIICAIILALYHYYKFTFVLLLVALLDSGFILPWYFSSTKNLTASDTVELTILHSNVLTRNVEFDQFIKLINQESPDIFVMQEVNQKWLQEMGELEKVYTLKYGVPQEDNFGIALFSKYPFETVKKVYWGDDSYVPSLVATLEVSGQRVTVIATHPLPPVGKEYYDSRNSQIAKVADVSRRHKGPLVVVGDLNTTMWSHAYTPLEQGTNLHNAREGFGLLPTWPTQFQLPLFMIPLDHFLVSPHFVVHDIRVGKNIGSDHLPLIVKLGLKE